MNEYRIVYQCSNGYEDEVIVSAVNRMMAFEMFKELEIADIINADCFRVSEKED